jgi:NADH-quinone oxidoreductase subunit E
MSVRRLAEEAVQPAGFAFNRANAAWAKQTIKKYPLGREQSAVIPLLMRAQEQEGWVTRAAIEQVADMIGMPYIRALEVATFYTQFQLKPVGTRAHVQVCGTTPCMLRGSEALMEVCRKKIHPEQFHTNPGGTLSWEEVECLGACVNAPMVMIFKDTYEDLTPERLGEIIDAFEAGKGATVAPGPQIDRLCSAPASGLTSLTDESRILKAARQREEREQAEPAAEAVEAPVPPSRAAKPKTYTPETDPTLKSPSPQKVDERMEKAASAPAPKENKAQADMAAEPVEKTRKRRAHPDKLEGSPTAYESPQNLEGAPIGPAGKRRKSETAAPPAEPTPESKTTDVPGGKPNEPGWVKNDEGQ